MAKIETKIGKDVIESLTLGMYEDARFIFREYIQNSADQIDKAVKDNLFQSLDDGKIEIQIGPSIQTISISDNATGIESDKVQSILKNIAASTKDRTQNKGFRGIGRLGGLAYCDKLIFETSFKGEAIKSFLIWDAQKLKAIINNRATKEKATDVIDEVTSFKTESESKETHYFKVHLEGVTNKALLDKDDVYLYLSMVAPVKYNKGFIYKNIIYDKAKELNLSIDEYSIFINNDQIFKRYTTSVYKGEIGNKKKVDEIYSIETYEIKSNKNDLLAWGWYSISEFRQAMSAINIARGIRLRKGNIQIGSEDTSVRLFKEPRGTKYFFGEIHIVSPMLIPNSRRDYFLDNAALNTFEKLIKQKFIELHKLYYFSSKVRNEQKKIDDYASFAEEFNQKANDKGFTDNEEKRSYQEKLEVKKQKAESAQKELSKAKQKSKESSKAHQKVFEKVVNEEVSKIEEVSVLNDSGKTKYITDAISTLSRKDKKLVSRIFGVIDNVLPKDLANIVKEKIKEELQT